MVRLVWFMVFNATFNNISIISWQSVLLVGETGGPRENHRPVTSHWQTLSHNVVWSSPRHQQDSNSHLPCDHDCPQINMVYAIFPTNINEVLFTKLNKREIALKSHISVFVEYIPSSITSTPSSSSSTSGSKSSPSESS